MIKQSAFSDALKSTSAQGAAAGGALGLLASLFSKNRSLKRSLGWTAAGLGLGGLAGTGFAALQGKLVKKEEAPALLSQPETAKAVRKNKGIGVGGAIGIGAGAAVMGGGAATASKLANKWYQMSPAGRELLKDKWRALVYGGGYYRDKADKLSRTFTYAPGLKKNLKMGMGNLYRGAASTIKKHPTAAGITAVALPAAAAGMSWWNNNKDK